MEFRVAKPGDVVGGKYEVTRILGRGGAGLVVEARHVRLHQTVAIKILLPYLAALPDAVARFEREAMAIARIQSPHVIKVFDVDLDAETNLPFIVMERLYGNDLASELLARNAVPLDEAVDWILQACAGLRDAHALGIVHRDIKPSNLFLSEQTPRVLKVMDFGASKVTTTDGRELTTSNDTLGTPSYMAPEQLLASRSIDRRVDVFALGVVLYRAIAGRFPFDGDTNVARAVAIATQEPLPLREAAPGVPAELAHVVMQMLARDRDARPANVTELARRLSPFGSGRFAMFDTPSEPSAPVLTVDTPTVDALEPTLSGPSVLPNARSHPPSSRRSVAGAAILAIFAAVAILVATQFRSGVRAQPGLGAIGSAAETVAVPSNSFGASDGPAGVAIPPETAASSAIGNDASAQEPAPVATRTMGRTRAPTTNPLPRQPAKASSAKTAAPGSKPRPEISDAPLHL